MVYRDYTSVMLESSFQYS